MGFAVIPRKVNSRSPDTWLEKRIPTLLRRLHAGFRRFKLAR